MKDILVVLIIGFALSLIKKIKGEDPKEATKPQPPKEKNPHLEEDGKSDLPGNYKMQKKEPFLRNEPKYFTYETIDGDNNYVPKREKIQDDNPMQTIDIEEEKPIELQFDHDEICKGIIYSEILKRKY